MVPWSPVISVEVVPYEVGGDNRLDGKAIAQSVSLTSRLVLPEGLPSGQEWDRLDPSERTDVLAQLARGDVE